MRASGSASAQTAAMSGGVKPSKPPPPTAAALRLAGGANERGSAPAEASSRAHSAWPRRVAHASGGWPQRPAVLAAAGTAAAAAARRRRSNAASPRRLADEFGECRRRQPREARAGVDERGGERQRAARRGVAERRAPALVDVVGGRAAREQPARDVGVAGGGGAAELRPRVDQPEHRRVHLRVVVAVRALAQPAEHVEPPLPHREVERRKVRRRLLGALRVGALAEQPLQHVEVAHVRRPVGGRAAAAVDRVDVGALVHEPLRRAQLAREHRPRERGVPARARQREPARTRLQRAQRLGVAARRRLAEGRGLGSVHGCVVLKFGSVLSVAVAFARPRVSFR